MKRLFLSLIMFSVSTLSFADNVATGTITKYGVGKNNFHVYIQAIAGSPCNSGYFYSYIGDTDSFTWKALQETALNAYTNNKQVTIYDNTVLCNSGTNSRFIALSID